MKEQSPLSASRLATAGFSLFGNVIVGLVLGLLANRFLHWDWAVPVGILLGFIAGFISMIRQLSRM
jgi:F0F1-type ATP synthase assembly protein I